MSYRSASRISHWDGTHASPLLTVHQSGCVPLRYASVIALGRKTETIDHVATYMRRKALRQQTMQTLPQMRGFAQPQVSY
ncbi:hypothetical protein F6Y24_06335 [Xanthomonas arboricola pv. pruni]|nr:hypothetical protein C1H21_04790 [Xanthomonas arboricola pv. juglandis]QEX76691.1 hypothetical protein F6Y24_06335 [Xanthomonas arboricola pv. pruni]RST75742.1 hypothetical protein EJK96_00820 [Xanthomonas arboricola pv. pruni]RST80333.1 hypothetical protein EJL05_07490 [Xanthomonas arboricola pv. pruni]